MKNSTKFILIIVISLCGICLLCGIFSIIYSLTPQGRADATRRAAVTMITLRPLPSETPVPANTHPAPTETLPPATPTPAPTETPLPTLTPLYAASDLHPTPRPGLYDEIHANRSSMTSLQFKDYCASLIGQRIHLEGSVTQVFSDYRLLIDPDGGGFLDGASVTGLPKDIAIQIPKDSRISLDGTITGFTDFLGLDVDVADPTLYWVR